MTSDVAACLARLAAELASDSIQLSVASPNSSRSGWRSLTSRSRVENTSISLSVERRLQRFITLDDFRRALVNAGTQDIHQIQEVAINTILTNAFALGDTVAFRQSIAQCFVLLLSRSETRFTDDAVGRMLDSISNSSSSPIQALPSYICTTFQCITQISSAFPSRIIAFHPQLTKTVKRVQRSGHTSVRACAIQCLAAVLPNNVMTSDVAKIIAKAIVDRSADVRAAIAFCIPKLPNPVTILAQLLEDPDEHVRQSAIEAFSQVQLAFEGTSERLMALRPLFEKLPLVTSRAMINCLRNCSGTGQPSTLAVEIISQLMQPDMNSARQCSSVIVEGLLLHSNSFTRRAVMKSLLQLVEKKSVSSGILSTCLDIAFACIQLLGCELTSDLEDTLLELLLSALSNPISQIRLQSASTLQQLARNRPTQTTTVLRILQNVAAIHIAEVTVSASDTRNIGAALASLHGHCHALAALISIVSSLDTGIPDVIISDLFKMATNLASIYTGDVRANPALSMVCAESAWVVLDALLLQGVSSAQLSQTLFPLWKTYMKTDRTAHSFAQTVSISDSNASASVTDAVAAIHIRRWALTALKTLVRCAGSVVLQDRVEVLKPIAAILNEAMIMAEAVKSIRDSVLDDPLLMAEFQAFKATLLDVFVWLPLSMFQSRHIPLLHLCVSEFTSRHAYVSRSLELSLTESDRVLSDDTDDITIANYLGGLDAQSQPSLCSLSNHDAIWSSSLDELPSRYRFYHRFAVSPSAQRAVDASIKTFGSIFKLQQPQHQIQLLTHFHSIQSQQQESYQNISAVNPLYNIACALLCTLLDLIRSHHPKMDASVRNVLVNLLRALSISPFNLVRRAACECLGLLCRLEDSTFTSQLMDELRQILQSNTQQSSLSVTGSIFTMVNVHRHVGIIGTIQYLPFTIMALQSLFEHTGEPLRTYVVHSLWCLVDLSGTNFAPYARSSLDLILLQILSDQNPIPKSLSRIIARLIRSLLEILGPELNDEAGPLRKCEWLWDSTAADATSESIEGIQQFIFWSAESVANLCLIDRLKSLLSKALAPEEMVALVSCIKQIGMKEYNLIVEHGYDIGLLALLEHETDPSIQKHISNALETIVIVCNAPDRWLDFAKSVLALGQLPSNQTAPSEAPQSDAVAESAASISPVSWRTVACVTSCLASLLDTPNDFTQRLRDVVNLMCRAISLTDDDIRAAGLRGLSTILRRYWSVPDRINPDERLLQWDLPQIKAAIRSAMGVESSPFVKQYACSACCELLISDLMVLDESGVRRFLDLLTCPLSDQGQQLITNFSNRATFSILCSHLTSLCRVILARAPCQPDLAELLKRLLIAALKDRLILCGIHDIRSCNSFLFPPIFLSRDFYGPDWALYMQCLAKISNSDQNATRLVVGVAIQFMHMYLETVPNQDSEHEPELIAEWSLQSISTVYSKETSPDLEFVSHLLSSLSVIAETCSFGRLRDLMLGAVSIVKSVKQKVPDFDIGALRKIVQLAFSRILSSSTPNVDLLDTSLDLVQQILGKPDFCPKDAFTMAAWASYGMQSLSRSTKASFIIHAIVDVCVLRRDPAFDLIIEAIYVESFRLIEQDQAPDGNSAKMICIIEALLCTVCTRRAFQSELVAFINDCLRSPQGSPRFDLGLRVIEAMLKYSDASFHQLLVSITSIVIQVTAMRQTALCLSIVAGITILIEQISMQPGVFLSSVTIPLYLKLNHPDTQTYVTSFASAIGKNLRLAVQSLTPEQKLQFQRCLERSAAAKSVSACSELHTDELNAKAPGKKATKKSKVKKHKTKLLEGDLADENEFIW